LKRCEIRAPVTGKILTRFRNVGEWASPTQPIYEMSRGDTLRADFYVPQPLLSSLALGEKVYIRVDTEKGVAKHLPAAISYISDEFEFAPKNIQTRESRNELVFEIRVTSPNPDGILKKGMPVEIWKKMVP
jgi:HlyD family secretion protein